MSHTAEIDACLCGAPLTGHCGHCHDGPPYGHHCPGCGLGNPPELTLRRVIRPEVGESA